MFIGIYAAATSYKLDRKITCAFLYILCTHSEITSGCGWGERESEDRSIEKSEWAYFISIILSETDYVYECASCVQ